MRLPQSTTRSLAVPTIHLLTFGLAVAALCMVPLSAGAAAAQQLVCSRTEIPFGTVVVGQTETMLVTVTNTGQTSETISGIALSNSEFATPGLNLPLSLAAGQSVDVNISFTPTALRWTGGTIKLASDASNSTLVLEVGGTGVTSDSVTASPAAVTFGQVAIGATSTLPIVLTNARPWNVTLWPLQTAGGEFSISTNAGTFPLTLGRGQSVTLNVTFAPQSTGATGGSLFIPGPALAIPLVGTGKAGTTPGQLTVTPASLSFGSVPDGTTSTRSLTLSAVGSSVTISSGTSSSAQFALNGASFPLTIAAGQSISFNVAFTPQSSGAVSGYLSFASNASSSGMLEPLTGTGTAPAPGQLTIAPATLNFGNVPDGTMATRSVTLSAVGSSVTISSGTSSSPQFVLNGASFPLTIAAGQSTSFNVAFTPQSSGTVSGSLSFASNASSSGMLEPVTGTGTAPAPGQLTYYARLPGLRECSRWNDSNSVHQLERCRCKCNCFVQRQQQFPICFERSHFSLNDRRGPERFIQRGVYTPKQRHRFRFSLVRQQCFQFVDTGTPQRHWHSDPIQRQSIVESQFGGSGIQRLSQYHVVRQIFQD